jgi:hypothetical protein
VTAVPAASRRGSGGGQPEERRWPRERRKRCLNHLDHIADKVIAAVPVRKQAGTMAWARALGAA